MIHPFDRESRKGKPHPFDRDRREEKPWERQEKRLAKRTGGKRTPASGATPSIFKKEDVLTLKFVYQTKSTSKKSYTIRLEDLRKLLRTAIQTDKNPVFVIEFVEEEKLTVFDEREWALVPLSFLLEVCGENKER